MEVGAALAATARAALAGRARRRVVGRSCTCRRSSCRAGGCLGMLQQRKGRRDRRVRNARKRQLILSGASKRWQVTEELDGERDACASRVVRDARGTARTRIGAVVVLARAVSSDDAGMRRIEHVAPDLLWKQRLEIGPAGGERGESLRLRHGRRHATRQAELRRGDGRGHWSPRWVRPPVTIQMCQGRADVSPNKDHGGRIAYVVPLYRTCSIVTGRRLFWRA